MGTSHIIFQSGHLWWLWSAVALAAAAGVALLYRYERRLVAARIGNTLLALRLAAVAVLFFALLQPVLAVVRGQSGENRVLIAIDVSQSMHASDPHASDAEKLRWARALGMIGNEATNSQLDQWLKTLEEQNPPDGAAATLAADLGGEHPAYVLETFGKLPRREIVERLLTSTSAPLLERLQRVADVRIELFADKAVPADAQLLLPTDEALRKLGLNAGTTDLRAAIAADDAARAAAPTAIVLLTDGRDTAARDPVAAARARGRDGVPIFPVMIGSPRRPADITVAGVDSPSSVFLGDTPRLTATLTTAGFEGRTVDVELRPPNGEPLRQSVEVAEATTDVHFDWPAETAGRQAFSLVATPQAGELSDDNNAAEFAITVIDDTIRVLLIEDEARWEFRFIDNAYRRDSRVDVVQVVFEQPFLGVLDAAFFPRELGWPDEPDQWDKSPLAETDLVIIGDVSPRFVTPRAWEALERYVDAGRGTLVLLAGKGFAVEEELPPALERLLPVSDLRIAEVSDKASQGSPTERGFHLRLTSEGEREPMLQFAADAESNREIWRDFPGHPWGMTGTPKPGASVLATMAHSADDAADDENDRALLVRQPYGLGQVLWLGIDSTWRWRHRAGDRYHHRFWGQLARWAARHRHLGGSDGVKFGFERSDITQGEAAVLRARFSRVFLEQFPRIEAAAEIFAAGETRPLQTVRLQPSPGRPLAYEGRVVDLPPGEFTARLKIDGADQTVGELAATLLVAPPASRELADLSADEELLRNVAEAGGGQLIGPDGLAELPEQLVAARESRDAPGEIAIWHHPLLLVVFCALVTAEWATRKLNGLP